MAALAAPNTGGQKATIFSIAATALLLMMGSHGNATKVPSVSVHWSETPRGLALTTAPAGSVGSSLTVVVEVGSASSFRLGVSFSAEQVC